MLEGTMVSLRDVRSLTDFQRHTKKHLARLKESGRPEVLTVNGEAELVVQSAEGYQQLREEAELARSLKVIQKSMAQAKAGKVRPMKTFLKELAAKHGMELQ